MGIKKWLANRKENDAGFEELTLSSMKPGFLVDYDMKTWEVGDCYIYDYDGDMARECELRSGDGDVRFLERAEDEGRVDMTLTRRISLKDVKEDVAGTILDQQDPPEVISFEEVRYQAAESSTGTRRKDGDPGDDDGEDDDGEAGRDFVSWTYESEGGRVLFVVQSGERDFAAYEGECVEEYQFTDILPEPAG